MNSIVTPGSPRGVRAVSSPLFRIAPLAVLLGAWIGGCHKGAPGGTGSPPNTILAQPGSANLQFVTDSNERGSASSLVVRGIYWGRLADVFDTGLTGAQTLRHHDFLVGETIASGVDYTVEENSLTERLSVTIRYPFSTSETSDYYRTLMALDDGLIQVTDKSLDVSELPPFPVVPRNATLVVIFNDLIDENTLDSTSVRVVSGYPPITPFDARVFADPNHGDLRNPGEFRSTRVLIDPTVSVLEAQESTVPLALNPVGFPASITQSQASVGLRFPTRTTLSQPKVLRNTSGKTLSTTQNGSLDGSSATIDVVRGVRSGGNTSITGDLNNGFLADSKRPSVLGTQAVTVRIEPGVDAPGKCHLEFTVAACALRLQAGDVIKAGATTAIIPCLAPPCLEGVEVTGQLVGSTVFDVPYTIVDGPAFQSDPNVAIAILGQVSFRYHPNVLAAKVPCFLRFPNIGQAPDQRVQPDAPVFVRFTEPMDPATLKPFDTLTVTRRDPNTTTLTSYDYVVGQITPTSDLREFAFSPSLPLTHDPAGANPAESYFLQLAGGVAGVTDLAGNALLDTLPRVLFRLDPQAAKQDTDGFVLRFSSNDELPGIGNLGTLGVGKREMRGQFLFDFDRQVMKPRPSTHYSAAADRTQPLPANMAASAVGVQTPLSKLGCKLQTIWRYCDVGFSLQDETTNNVDVEGLNWSPIGGSVIADNFTRFEMSLCTSVRLPDETFNPMTGLAVFPGSGLLATYAQNLLDAVNDPLRTVYPVPTGPTNYTVVPADIFQGPTGSLFMPWPMNKGIPTSKFAYYTWRDTGLQQKGGTAPSPGAELAIVNAVLGLPAPMTPLFPAGSVPSFGLPLLMEFRCYPDETAQGVNTFDINNAIATDTRPGFRAFSAGGVNSANQVIRKDPDLELVATGGFNPAGAPPGVTTLPTDNSFFLGQMDLVVRLSRVHSIWFDAVSGTVVYAAPVVEPRSSDQPSGTQVRVEFRAGTANTNNVLLTDALMLDVYGEKPAALAGADVSFLNGDRGWKPSLTALSGARFFQTRLTFVSNAETNLSPELSALGFSWRK